MNPEGFHNPVQCDGEEGRGRQLRVNSRQGRRSRPNHVWHRSGDYLNPWQREGARKGG